MKRLSRRLICSIMGGGTLAAARILSAVQRYSEAESRLESLLLVNDLEPDLRDQVCEHLDQIRRQRPAHRK